MISRLVRSAFQTGCLSVESEGLIRQILLVRGYQPSDLTALQDLWLAIAEGQIKREASSTPYATAIVTDVFTLLWSVLNGQQIGQLSPQPSSTQVISPQLTIPQPTTPQPTTSPAKQSPVTNQPNSQLRQSIEKLLNPLP
jgi:hypothetical protein